MIVAPFVISWKAWQLESGNRFVAAEDDDKKASRNSVDVSCFLVFCFVRLVRHLPSSWMFGLKRFVFTAVFPFVRFFPLLVDYSALSRTRLNQKLARVMECREG